MSNSLESNENTARLSSILEDLTGQEPPFPKDLGLHVAVLFESSGIGHSQFNELLLLLGYDRVTDVFFQYLAGGDLDSDMIQSIQSLDQLEKGVERFRELAALRFGNVKFAFKYFSSPTTDLNAELSSIAKIEVADYQTRHEALLPIDLIPGNETFYLGYIIKRQLDERIKSNPNDSEASAQLKNRDRIVDRGKKNHEAYLVSDHLDVYVATSMRERHEFMIVNQVVKDVFQSHELKDLKLRYFDPTQAYCEERIDKGLAEALMLKRAKCTLYLAQESDTLGKDSELACTLAQGKAVIAYIPSIAESEEGQFVEDLIKQIKSGESQKDDLDLLLRQLQIFEPSAAWTDPEVRSWIDKSKSVDIGIVKKRLGRSIRLHYDSRAKTLKESHPLGIQVHLETGVANGVIVARSTHQCAVLIRQIVTNTLEFKIVERQITGNSYLMLVEKSTGSVFRVVTGDRFLTNAFWNFYLPE